MGIRIGILIGLWFVSAQLYSQSVKRNLLSAGSCFYKQHIYAFGYEQRKESLVFKCFSYSANLQLKDSTEFSLGKHTSTDYLEISSDTIHNVLNFYFQLANQKNRVTLLRLDTTLKTICAVSDYDANHINSLTAFDDESYSSGKDLYLIKTNSDSATKQFYLSKYSVKAMDKPFEYDFKWQYAFERQYIHRATVVYADSNDVILYAHVNDGIKKGQWILRINAKTGTIKKGTKLSAKGDTRNFMYSKSLYNPTDKSIDVIGSIYPAGMIDFKNHTADFKTLSAAHQLFILQIDSAGEAVLRIEKPLPIILPAKPGVATLPLHFKVREFTKQADKSYNVIADLYEQTQPNIMCYSTSWNLSVIPKEEDYMIKAAPINSATKVIPDFISFTKGDTYGKIYLKDMGDYDKFKYTNPLNPVVVKTATDNTGNLFYVLKKTNILNGKKVFNYVFSGKKGLENKVLLSTEKGQNVAIYFIDKASYISFVCNAAQTEFELKINNL
ncbi:MAG: hypothetical protein V4506_04435 [Bacteroidota bacterium]